MYVYEVREDTLLKFFLVVGKLPYEPLRTKILFYDLKKDYQNLMKTKIALYILSNF